MMKKIAVVIILVFLIAIGVAIYALNRENAKIELEETSEIEENMETVNETENEETSNGVTEEKQEEQENEETQRNVEKQTTITSKEETEQSVKTEQSENKSQVQEESVATQTSPTTSNAQEEIQEQTSQVDEEYEKLKKQVEYDTYEECQKAGFEKALADTVNILGFSCQEIIYKGEVLGYKLRLDYTNPME